MPVKELLNFCGCCTLPYYLGQKVQLADKKQPGLYVDLWMDLWCAIDTLDMLNRATFTTRLAYRSMMKGALKTNKATSQTMHRYMCLIIFTAPVQCLKEFSGAADGMHASTLMLHRTFRGRQS